MLLVGVDNRADQLMPDDIALGEINKRDARHGFQSLERLDQARALVRGQIDLGDVARHDAFGVRPDARQQHEHLLGRGVLRFVENNKGIAERATAHVGERRDFDGLAGHRALDFFRIEHVAQRIVERPQIGRDFFLQDRPGKTRALRPLRPPGGSG